MKKKDILGRDILCIMVGPKFIIHNVIIYDNNWTFSQEKFVYYTSYLTD